MDKGPLLSSLSFASLQPFVCEVHPAVPLQLLQIQESKEADERQLAALLIGTAVEGLVEVKSCVPFYVKVTDKISFRLSSLNELVELVKDAQPKAAVVGLFVSGDLSTVCLNLWGRLKTHHKTAQALLTVTVGETGVDMRCFRVTAWPQYPLALVQEVPVTLQTKELAHIQPVQRLSQAVQALREQVRLCKEYLARGKPDPAVTKLLLRCAKALPPCSQRLETDIEMIKYLSSLVKTQLQLSDSANNLL
jgi:hypothetical protein